MAVSAGLIAVVVVSVDRSALAANLARIDPVGLLPAIVLIWSTTFVSAWRWSIVIRSLRPAAALRPTYWRLWSLYWIGQFFNQLLPSGLGGDGMRMWLLRRTGLPTGTAITSVVVDRVAALAAIALLVAAVLPFAFDGANGNAVPVWLWGVVAACAFGVAFVAGMGAVRLPASALFASSLFANPLIRGLRRLGADFWTLMRQPGHLAAALGASVVVQMLGAASVYAIAQSLGVRVGLLPCLALMPIVVLATAVPVSIAGWGVREVAMVAVLATIGVAQESALLISVFYGGIAVATSLPGGVLWLFGRRADGDRQTASKSPLTRAAQSAAE